MDIVITGASGFLGAAVVRAALAQGHRVRALLRPAPGRVVPQGRADGRLVYRAVRLQRSAELVQALRETDAVIHVAASMGGTQQQQYADTVEATRALLGAMQDAGVRRLVGISSLSVYDYRALAEGATLDEQSPLECDMSERDTYGRCKLLQEQLFWSYAAHRGHQLVVLRPGLIYDAGRWPMHALAVSLGPLGWLALEPHAGIPLVHVDDVASAILAALQRFDGQPQVANLVEKQPPTRLQLLSVLRAAAVVRSGHIWRLPWSLHLALARVATGINDGLCAGRLPLPGLLRTAQVHARFKPLHYDASQAEAVLGWRPKYRALSVATGALS